MSTIAPPPEPVVDRTGNMRISRREAKLVTERILLLTGLDAGLVPDVRDLLIDAETVEPGALQILHDEIADSSVPAEPSIEIVGRHPMRVDGQGAISLFVAPAIADLVTLEVLRDGAVSMLVEQVRFPWNLRALAATGNRWGIATWIVAFDDAQHARIAHGAGRLDSPILTSLLSPGAMGQLASSFGGFHPGSPVGDRVWIIATRVASAAETQHVDPFGLGVDAFQKLREGFPVTAALWWDLYHRSNQALTRTSAVSRTHAGRTAEELLRDPDGN